MKRKEYEKPAMKAVELQQRTMLLYVSDPNALSKPADYESADDPFSDE